MADVARLTPRQAHALLDILSHHELNTEIRDFRYPRALSKYGPPFQTDAAGPSAYPSLQALVTKFLLPLPGLCNVSEKFWKEQVANVIEDFEEAQLSESYDKGNVGIRRTLATASSALLEYLVRGIFAGFEVPEPDESHADYDLDDADDLHTAFMDFMRQIVYGNILDELFAKAAETDKLADHPRLVQAAHEFILVNLASFMHYTLILSPKGQYLLWLVDHANKLVPYAIIRQTLKIGNVASMINAMVKVVLAKMSMTSVTNWMGLTQSADEGMNLLQHIISTTLSWDNRDLRSKASKIEKQKDAPNGEQLQALRAYLSRSQEEQESLREVSRTQALSIVHVALLTSSAPTELSEAQHRYALDYLALHLSIRDREQIVKVLCHSQPDHLTQAVRDLVAAYEPIIRAVHNAVDLSETLNDFEAFLKDTIKLSRLPTPGSAARSRPFSRTSKASETPTPTVGDFVQLLKKHQYSLHKFLHQIAKNGKEVTSWFQNYARQSALQFRRPAPTQESTQPQDQSWPNAGALHDDLQALFGALDPGTQKALLPLLDAEDRYLSQLHASSAQRLRAVVQSSSTSNHPALASKPSSRAASPAPPSPSIAAANNNNGAEPAAPARPAVDPGPGAFLARWQALVDDAEITPAEAQGGRVRGGGGGSVVSASRRGPAPELAEPAEPPSSAGGAPGSADDGDEDVDVFEEAKERLEDFELGDAAPGAGGGIGVGGGGSGIGNGGSSSSGGAKAKARRPDVQPVVDALLDAFRTLLARRSAGARARARAGP